VQRRSTRKGILLAGGTGTRFAPLMRIVTKQLLPLFDKPTIYYPLSLLMLAGIREITIVSDPENLPLIRKLLDEGRELGLELHYATQGRPAGIAEALIIAEHFLAGGASCLALGDNILYGHELTTLLRQAAARDVSTIFGINVHNPQDYGVVTLDARGRPITIEEKPRHPKSRIAVPGLYFLDHDAPSFARQVTPGASGELEITSVINHYMAAGRLRLEMLGRGFAGSMLERTARCSRQAISLPWSSAGSRRRSPALRRSPTRRAGSRRSSSADTAQNTAARATATISRRCSIRPQSRRASAWR